MIVKIAAWLYIINAALSLSSLTLGPFAMGGSRGNLAILLMAGLSGAIGVGLLQQKSWARWLALGSSFLGWTLGALLLIVVIGWLLVAGGMAQAFGLLSSGGVMGFVVAFVLFFLVVWVVGVIINFKLFFYLCSQDGCDEFGVPYGSAGSVAASAGAWIGIFILNGMMSGGGSLAGLAARSLAESDDSADRERRQREQVAQWREQEARDRRMQREEEVRQRQEEQLARAAEVEAAAIQAEATAPLVQNVTALTGDYRIDALLSGYQVSQSTVTYSFYEDDVFHGAYGGTETVSEVSEGVKTNVRAIMAMYSALINVTFVEVTETANTVGVIRVMRSTAPGYAYAYYPASTSMFSVTSDVHLNPSYDRLGDTNGFQNPAGEHGYLSLIHEIGHAIGLKHPHDGSPNLPSAEDNHTSTVMSYQFLGESPGTPMGYDTMALHYMYGARPQRGGNDTYRLERPDVDQYSVGGQLYINPSLTTKQVIWDSGGYNVLDLSAFTAASGGYRVDLRPLGWISANVNYFTTYLKGGVVVGPGVTVPEGGVRDAFVTCPAGQHLLGGGLAFQDNVTNSIIATTPSLTVPNRWDVRALNHGPGTSALFAWALCLQA